MNAYSLATAPLVVTFLVYPRRRVALCGQAAAVQSFRYAAEIANERSKVRFLLDDNDFDPYRVARFARDLGRDWEETLIQSWFSAASTASSLQN
jgi:hypothetical protein